MREGSRKRRALVVVIGVLSLTAVFVGGAQAYHTFSDVPTDAFYHSDVTWLASTGITSGCGGGKFCPNNAVTRGRMAVFLHKMVNRTRTGHFSCDGTSFVPTSSTITFATKVSGGAWRYSTAGSALLWCNAVIPDGATVTKVTFTAKDSDPSGEFVSGALSRTNLASGAPGLMALTAGTGAASTPGVTTLTDTTVSSAVIDNASNSYRLEVTLDGTDSSVGLYGATVEFTYLGTPAP